MNQLRVLLLEDSHLDAELVLAALAGGGIDCTVTRVQTRAEYEAALALGGNDLILADYSLPSFDGVTALRMAREVCLEVPFIFVSGAMGEEVAIETLKSGATDYVLKDRLERLAPSVRRALREAADRVERRRLEEELRHHAEELAEAHRRKDEFIAVLSHELRNPLAPIRNALQLMRLRGVSDPVMSQARDIIDRQVTRLAQLVDDLLDVSRISRGKVQLRLEPVDLSSVVPHAVETVRDLVEQRQHTLHLDICREPLWVNADRLRLEQVLTNLLTNAAKYTDPGGHIWLSTAQAGAEAILCVRDDGIGIPPDLLPRVFDLFIQAEQSLDRAQGGLGIGLTLTRQLVEMQGGHIHAASPGTGHGSEFTVHLPLTAAPATEDAPAGSAARDAGRKRRVLVVDDNKDGAESLGMLLRMWGHEVRLAHDGATALRLAAAEPPDVLLLDIGLPGLDGYEVARGVRAARGRQPVLVALTGYGQEEDRRRTREAGFDHHLTKPVDPEQLAGVFAAERSEPK